MKTKFLLVLLLILPVIFIQSCSNTTNPTDHDANSNLSSKLDKIGDSLTTKLIQSGLNKSIPGVIIGVSYPETNFSYLKSFGKSDITNNTSLIRNDEIRIGTFTQTFMVALTFMLIEEGKLSLEDDLNKHLQVPHSGDRIKIRNLIQNKTDIADFSDSIRFYQNEAPNRKFSNDEIIAFIFNQKNQFSPTNNINYSNSNYLLLGLVLENAGKDNLQNLISSKILLPLALKNTYFDNSSLFKSGYHSNGYIYADSTGFVDYTNKYNYSWSKGISNMTSNAHDIMSWISKFAEGSFLSSDSQNEIQSFEKAYTKNNLDIFMGKGIMKIGSFIGFTGEFYGYYTSAYYLPGKKSIIYIFTNSQNANDNLMIKIAQILYPGSKAS